MTVRKILISALAIMIGLAGCAKKSEPKDGQSTQGAATQASQATLMGTKWLLAELNGSPVPSDTAKEPVYISFNPNGSQVAGFGGCNRLTGSFQINGDTLIFGHMVSAKMACPTGEDIEMKLLAALETVWTYAIVGDMLELKGNSATVARFKAAKV